MAGYDDTAPQVLSPGQPEWLLEPLSADDLNRLKDLAKFDVDASGQRFRTAWRREEIRLRALG